MKLKKYKCINCGYEKSSENEDFTCPICNGLLNEQIGLQEALDAYFEASIKRDIDSLGNDRVFEIIEGFSRPETRLAYRRIFTKYGGKIPKRKINI